MAIIMAKVIRMDTIAEYMNRDSAVAKLPKSTQSSIMYIGAKYRQSRVLLVPSL